MFLYLDASALVKRYVAERGSTGVMTAVGEATAVATSTLSRAEVAGALAKAVREGILTEGEATGAVQFFRNDWADFVRIRVTEAVIGRTDDVAWRLGLQAYAAVHLVSALLWQEKVGHGVVLATYDGQLWRAAGESGLERFPKRRP